MSLNIIHNVLAEPVFKLVNMNTTQTSTSIPVQGITCYAIQSSWTGFTGDGTEKITTYASNDEIIWSQIDSFIPTTTVANGMLNVEKAGYRFVRVIYTPGSGTVGTLLITISGKVI